MSDNIITVKRILGICDMKLDSYLIFCEKRISDAIMSFCNIDEIPKAFNSLIQEFLIEQYTLNKDGIGEGKMIVSSASDVNQSVGFKNVGGAETMSKNVASFINKNEDSLIPYRKMRW